MQDLLAEAVIAAGTAHFGQKDKAGNPYVLHPMAVMLMGKTLEEQMVGVLHDVLEDTEYDLEYLEEIFPEEVVTAIIAITRNDEETVESYYARVKVNPLALAVKLNDIAHNSDPARLALIADEELRNRLTKKYKKALQMLA